MEVADLIPLIEQLEDNIDDLKEALTPLIRKALSDTAGTLPLLDRAKLYVLVTYAIESILFSFVRLQGLDAKQHPVFRELSRVKQYFEKIKTAEAGPQKMTNRKLDREAAGRFIKHALATNEQLHQLGKYKGADEKANLHVMFEQGSKKRKIDKIEGQSLDSNELTSPSSDSASSRSSTSAPAQRQSGADDTQSSVAKDNVVQAGPETLEAKPAEHQSCKGQRKKEKQREKRRSAFKTAVESNDQECVIPSNSQASSSVDHEPLQPRLAEKPSTQKAKGDQEKRKEKRLKSAGE